MCWAVPSACIRTILSPQKQAITYQDQGLAKHDLGCPGSQIKAKRHAREIESKGQLIQLSDGTQLECTDTDSVHYIAKEFCPENLLSFQMGKLT